MKGVSIIICTYNGRDKISKTLDFLEKIEFEGAWELIIIDNNSVDNTFDFIKNRIQKSIIKIQLLSCNIPGKMNAFWMGIQNAQYDYLLDCDDDNWLCPNYLELGYQILESNQVIGALGGKGIPFSQIELPEWFNRYQLTYAVGAQGEQNGDLGDRGELYGAGTFFRKRVLLYWNELGFSNMLTCRIGNKLASGGDTELCHALIILGYEIWYHEDLQFYHNIEDKKLNLEYLIKLKKGIASSFPLLHAFRIKEFANDKDFSMFLRRENKKNMKGLILSSIAFFLKRDLKNLIFKITYKELLSAYYRNRSQTIEYFNKIKGIKEKHAATV